MPYYLNRRMNMKKKLILGILIFAIIIGAGVGISKLAGSPGTSDIKTVTVYGAVGGGKENFLADPDVIRIMAERYGITVQNDAWSNGKLIKNELTYTDKDTGAAGSYDFVFFSDQRYYEYYQLDAQPDEAPRLKKQRAEIILNTPIVFYSWDLVVDALMKEDIVTERGGVYYISDMNKLLGYIADEKKWKDIGLPEIYGNINIGSTDPVTSSPGATYYGLLASVMSEEQLSSKTLAAIMPDLQHFYRQSGFMNNTPADLFDLYLRTGYGAKPIIVDYEKSMIDFAVNNPEGYAGIKDRIRILYSEPTIWNSHCIISFTDNGTRFIEALNDKEIQEIAFNRYGFRTGLSGGQYDVKAIGVDGVPQEITSVVPGLKMDTYNLIIEGLKAVEF